MIDEHDDDATLRAMLAHELQRIGVPASGLPSLFASLQTASAPPAKPWQWLRSIEARSAVACLVLLLRHRTLTAETGAAYLTTFDDAQPWLGHADAIVVDVSSYMRAIEEQTGRPFGHRAALAAGTVH